MLPDPRTPSGLPRSAETRATATERETARPPHPETKRASLERAVPFSPISEAHAISPAVIDGLLQHLPTGLHVVDRDGGVVNANEAARSLKVEGLEPLHWAVTRALLTEDAVREDEIAVVTPGQPRRWLSAYVMPVRVSGIGVAAATVTLSDVTARTRMRAWDPVIESLVNL